MEILTKVHVGISLIAIFSGFIVVFGLLNARQFELWTSLFIRMTFATSVTGFFFPFQGLTPAFVVGIISLIILAVAAFALYLRELNGAWRWIYVVTAMLSLYLNVFVLIVQLFEKIPTLKALAPTQTELLFAIAQGLTLALFVVVTIRAVIKFEKEPA